MFYAPSDRQERSQDGLFVMHNLWQVQKYSNGQNFK